VDVLYEHRVRLVCSAAVEPLELFEHVVTQAEMRERSQGGQARARSPARAMGACVGGQPRRRETGRGPRVLVCGTHLADRAVRSVAPPPDLAPGPP